MKITKSLLILLFFTLPLVHGRIFPTFGLDIYFNVSGNFEFTKVMFFNIFSGVIFFSFFVESFVGVPFMGTLFRTKYLNQTRCQKITGYSQGAPLHVLWIYIILLLLSLSTLLSFSPFTSLIGDLQKGHTALMFFNLFGLFCILKNLEKTFLKKLIFASLLAGIFASLLAIKELYFSTYDYGALSNRAFGSFGHPNYLAGFLLLLLPLISYCSPPSFVGKTEIQRKIIKWFCYFILITGILFSKSIVAIVLVFSYIIFQFLFPLIKGNKAMVKILGVIGMFILMGIFAFLIKYAPEKLHSFLSRFYLWETTLKIIFSDIKIFLIGGGAETLPYLFDSFKVPQVYIYENFGFTADRPHNFALNIFYHFGVFALGLFLYFVYKFLKYLKNTPENITLLLFLLFGIIHYFSIASYLLIILILTSYSHKHKLSPESSLFSRVRGCKMKIIFFILTIISLTGSYYSIKLYHSEILFSERRYILKAEETFSHPKYLIRIGEYSEAQKLEGIISQKNFKYQISSSPEKQNLCDALTQKYSSAENYIYCGDIFWKLGKQDLAREYYNLGLSKLPDLWNQDSPYWDNYFVKKTITGNRFFSEDFGNINGILKKSKR